MGHGRTGAIARYTGTRADHPGWLPMTAGRGGLRGRVWIGHRHPVAPDADVRSPEHGDPSNPPAPGTQST